VSMGVAKNRVLGKTFVERSRDEFDAVLEQFIPVIKRCSRFGIFGTADAARYINKFLSKHSFDDVVSI
jgi:hypothetical protein